MGVSLRTLAKLTKPAMDRWWRKRGMRLMGAGLGCASFSFAIQLVYLIYPMTTLFASARGRYGGQIISAIHDTATVCFGLAAVFAAWAAARACQSIDDAAALPSGAVPPATVYALALKSTWPAVVACLAYYIAVSLLSIGFTASQSFWQDLLAKLLIYLPQAMDASIGQLMPLAWLAALFALPACPRWQPGAWAGALYLLPWVGWLAYRVTVGIIGARGTHEVFGSLTTNIYAAEIAALGLVLLGAVLILYRRGRRRWASGLSLVLLAGAALAASRVLPGVQQERMLFEWRLALENLAQLAYGLIKLPFQAYTPAWNSQAPVMISSLASWVRFSVPEWLTGVSTLINFAWLALLYLLLRFLLLREPRANASAPP